MSGEVGIQTGSSSGLEAFSGARRPLGSTEDGIREDVDNLASAIHARLHSIRREMVAIGRDLLRAKALLKHGQWMRWLSGEFGMSSRTAENSMNVATPPVVFGINKSEASSRTSQALRELRPPVAV